MMTSRPQLEGLESRDLPSAAFVGPVAIVAQTIPAALANPTPEQLLQRAIAGLAEQQQQISRDATATATDARSAERRVLDDPLSSLAQQIQARANAREAEWFANRQELSFDALNDLDHEPGWRIVQKTNELIAQWAAQLAYATVQEATAHARFHAIRSDPGVDMADKTRAYLRIFGWRGEVAALTENLRGLENAAAQVNLQGANP